MALSAINLKQVEVKFSTIVDESTAENLNSYKIDGATLTGTNTRAKLLNDGKTVLITLDASTYNFTQGTKKLFAVAADSVQEDGTGKYIPTKSQEITFGDTTAPTVKEVKVTGNKKITVYFNEAVTVASVNNAAQFKIDGLSLSAFGGSVAPVTDIYGDGSLTNEVVLNFDAALPAGDHTLTIGASTSPIVDTANFTLTKVDKPFTVENVTTAPTVTGVVAQTNGTVKVTFSQKINASSVTSGTPFNVNDSATWVNAVGLDPADTTGKTVLINFGSSLKQGANVLVIKKNVVADIYGNKVSPTADLRVPFEAVKDTVAPTVSSVYPTSETQIRVNFSEEVDPVYLVDANFVLKNAAGEVVYGGTGTAWNSITTGANSSQVNLNLTAAQAEKLGKAQYTLEIANIPDKAGNVMTATSKTFTTVDNTEPKLATGNNLLINTTKKTATVYFNEPMNATDIGNPSNYLYAANGSTFVALPSGSSIAVSPPGYN